MPTVFLYDGFRFFFYSNEGNPREPVHVHVRKGGAEAKFWVVPGVRLAVSHGFDARTLGLLTRVVEAQKDVIAGAWHEHFG
ncbi:MAG TPA: DUF4160 domain-containing protein [Paracoccaceae bacterium]|nr:DUF4160 domain-containing protein [Paracoccaceae bacterium]